MLHRPKHALVLFRSICPLRKMPSLTSKRFLFRLSIAGVFLIAIRFFIGWGHIKTPTYSLSTGSQAGNVFFFYIFIL